MAVYKRFRMEAALSTPQFVSVPPGFTLVPYRSEWLEWHARMLFLSFVNEPDSQVFPVFQSEKACLDLMREMTLRGDFLNGVTWLLQRNSDGEFAGAIQGVCAGRGKGAIQNLGVLPQYRGQGVGSALLERALAGFHLLGLKKISLEVTANNHAAIRLYRRHGFGISKTLFKTTDSDWLADEMNGYCLEEEPETAWSFV